MHDSLVSASLMCVAFVQTGANWVSLIIAELHLPNGQREMPSLDIGGIAGGTKVCLHPKTHPRECCFRQPCFLRASLSGAASLSLELSRTLGLFVELSRTLELLFVKLFCSVGLSVGLFLSLFLFFFLSLCLPLSITHRVLSLLNSLELS
jgi:hypothetical protein